jgi:hypothetical protein
MRPRLQLHGGYETKLGARGRPCMTFVDTVESGSACIRHARPGHRRVGDGMAQRDVLVDAALTWVFGQGVSRTPITSGGNDYIKKQMQAQHHVTWSEAPMWLQVQPPAGERYQHASNGDSRGHETAVAAADDLNQFRISEQISRQRTGAVRPGTRQNRFPRHNTPRPAGEFLALRHGHRRR